MERNVEIDKISDGKRYGANDLVKVGCDDCRGCSACCNGMGDSIVLDPMDVYRLEREINREHIPISLVRGMEIMSIGPLGKKIRERKLIPLHESRYYLIEVPFDMAPDGIRKRLLEFPAMGKIPVLAHPERYFCVQDTPELLYEFREMGAVLQINKGSVFGRFGEEAERTARFLLENRLAGCVASDAHGADYRTTDMRPVRQFLEERYGEAYAQLLVKVNPRRILEDRQIFYEPSPERKRKRRWFL